MCMVMIVYADHDEIWHGIVRGPTLANLVQIGENGWVHHRSPKKLKI